MKVIGQNQRHILILPSWYFDREAEGVFIHEHARMSAGQGHQVGIIYVKNANVLARAEAVFYSKDCINIGILKDFTLPKVMWASMMWKKKYLKLFKEYSQKYGSPHLIHAHGYIGGMAARYLSAHTAIPYVITEHSTSLPEETVPWYHRHAIRLAYQHAAGLIAVSEFLKKAMTSWLKSSQTIRVIGNPVDFSKLQLRSPGQITNKIRLISIGSLERRKNYRLLLQALSRVQNEFNVSLVLIGTGPELQDLKMLASSLKLNGIVDFSGYVTTQELVKEISNADFFVSTSKMENFGVAIVEALACGIPVIATQSGGPGEYMHPGLGRLVPGDDVLALSEAIKEAIVSRDDFHPAKIREYVKSKFDFPVIGPQVDAVYDDVLGQTT